MAKTLSLTSPVYVVRSTTAPTSTNLPVGAVATSSTGLYIRAGETNNIIKLEPLPEGLLTTSNIIDNLTSSSTTAALSANQGRVLNTRLTTAEGDIDDLSTGLQSANSSIDTLQSQVSAINSSFGKYIPSSQKGAHNGVAPLNATGQIDSQYLPSYVDDVVEGDTSANFPKTGEEGKIYVDLGSNLVYRWSGSAYVEIAKGLALGTTASTAFAGNRGLALETWKTSLGSRTLYTSNMSVAPSASTVVINSSVMNISSGALTAATGITLPAATSSSAGVMTAAQVSSLTTATSNISSLQSDVTALETWKNTTLGTKVSVNTLAAASTSSGLTISFNGINLSTGANIPVSVALPKASNTSAGIIDASTFAKIQSATGDVSDLMARLDTTEDDIDTLEAWKTALGNKSTVAAASASAAASNVTVSITGINTSTGANATATTTTIPAATTSAAGVMTSAQVTALNKATSDISTLRSDLDGLTVNLVTKYI